ncbi:MAG TPA: hypothetical protein VHC48_02655, partial [Puia sp.]|nr:hypothetical protein [Puia sp.]
QTNLFQDTGKKIQLYRAIDDVKNKYGKYSIVKAGGLEGDNDPGSTWGGIEASKEEQRKRTREERGPGMAPNPGKEGHPGKGENGAADK